MSCWPTRSGRAGAPSLVLGAKRSSSRARRRRRCSPSRALRTRLRSSSAHAGRGERGLRSGSVSRQVLNGADRPVVDDAEQSELMNVQSNIPGFDQRTTGAPEPSTLGGMALAAAAAHGGAAIREKRDGAWSDTSYSELGASIELVARGLIGLGIEHGDRVAILSETRPEWTLADLGALCAGAVVVPIYQTNSPEEVPIRPGALGMPGSCSARTRGQVAKVEEMRGGMPSTSSTSLRLSGSSLRATSSLGELRERRDGSRPRRAEGSSAVRKARGCGDDRLHLGHHRATEGLRANARRMCMATVQMYARGARSLAVRRSRSFLFLPLAHALARIAQMVDTRPWAGRSSYWQRDSARRCSTTSPRPAPTHLPSVPRVFEKIHIAAASEPA